MWVGYRQMLCRFIQGTEHLWILVLMGLGTNPPRNNYTQYVKLSQGKKKHFKEISSLLLFHKLGALILTKVKCNQMLTQGIKQQFVTISITLLLYENHDVIPYPSLF